MKIKTELLQKMVSKAIQGATNNKLIPLTGLIGIEVKNQQLILTTTDGSNQFRINDKIDLDSVFGPVNEQSFYTVVNADTFAKLVGKTTKEYITLSNNDNYLEVIGNGTYQLEIAINEEGEMVRFPDILDTQAPETTIIKLNNLQEAIKVAKASVAKTMELPYLTGYYLSSNVITTDRQMMCTIEDKLVENPILISTEIAELLLLVEGDNIELIKQDNTLLFYNDKYKICGNELNGKENYPAETVEGLFKLTYTDSIQVNKTELLNILDRMSLFVNDYDKNGVYLVFNNKGLLVRSQKSNAIETIIIPKERTDFQCLIDIEMLKTQIETVSTDIVDIHYGQDTSIKIIDGNASHIISLLEKAN